MPGDLKERWIEKAQNHFGVDVMKKILEEFMDFPKMKKSQIDCLGIGGYTNLQNYAIFESKLCFKIVYCF